jgi:hypothetical protein
MREARSLAAGGGVDVDDAMAALRASRIRAAPGRGPWLALDVDVVGRLLVAASGRCCLLSSNGAGAAIAARRSRRRRRQSTGRRNGR